MNPFAQTKLDARSFLRVCRRQKLMMAGAVMALLAMI